VLERVVEHKHGKKVKPAAVLAAQQDALRTRIAELETQCTAATDDAAKAELAAELAAKRSELDALSA
jgi:hypothetical protein